MLVIGLTGGIASGKTRIAELLRLKGVPIVDADAIARQVVAPGQPTLEAVAQAFGEGVLGPDGALDRARLAGIIFSDAAARERLNAIMHPAILSEMGRQIESLRRQPQQPAVAVAVLPLLFEAHCEPLVDGVLVARVSPQEQIRRLMARDGLGRDEAQRRVKAQMPLEEKTARADWVIDTETDAETLSDSLEGLLTAWREAGRGGGFQGQEGPEGGPAN